MECHTVSWVMSAWNYLDRCVQYLMPVLMRWKEANIIPVPKTRPPRSSQIWDQYRLLWCLWSCSSQSSVRGFLRGLRAWGSQAQETFYNPSWVHHWSRAIDKGQCVPYLWFWPKFLIMLTIIFWWANYWRLDYQTALWDGCVPFWHTWRWNERVKIGEVLSDWLEMSAGMPQGSFLG